MTVTIKDGQANVAAEFRRDMMAIQCQSRLTGNQPQPNKGKRVTMKTKSKNEIASLAFNELACSFEPRKKDLMISKIISRAAYLRELVSNPKSFSNCPDLHGGVPDASPGHLLRVGYGSLSP